jgi:hypothetical protein
VNWLTASQSLASGSSKSIALDQRRSVGPNNLAEGVVEGFRRQLGVQPDEGFSKAPLEDHVAVGWVAAFGARLAKGDLGAAGHGVALAVEPS